VLTLATLALAATQARAGLTEARKHLADKKYDQVDRALGKELQAASPSADVLTVSLDAAMASGRYVTAQRRVTALLKATSGRDLDMVYRGAQIAGLACDDSMALTRYVDFAQRSTVRSDKLRHALTVLAVKGKFPPLYAKTVRLYGADDVTWALGIGLLGRLVTDGEVNATFDQAQTLMESFPAPARVTEVHRRLLYAAENNKLGRDDQNVYVLPMRLVAQSVPSDYAPFAAIFARGASKVSKDVLLSLLFAHQTRAKQPLPATVLTHFNQMGALGSDEKKLAAGGQFLDLMPIYSKASDPAVITYYLSVIRDQTSVFKIKGRELVNEAVVGQILTAAVAHQAPSSELRRMPREIADRYLDTAARATVLRKHAAFLPADALSRLLPTPQGEQKDARIAEGNKAIASFLAGRNIVEVAQASSALLPWYNAAGDKAGLIQAARHYMALNPATFNQDIIKRYVLDSKLLSTEEKVALVRDQLVRAGKGHASSSMGQLFARTVKQLAKKTPQYAGLMDLYNADKPGTDVASRYACQPVFKRNRRELEKNAAATVTAFLKEYKKPLPLAAAACKTPDDVLALSIMSTCYSATRNSNSKREIAQAWVQRASGPAASLAGLARSVPADVLANALTRIGRTMKAGDPAWAKLADLELTPVNGASPLKAFYASMGHANALRHVAVQAGYLQNRRIKWAKDAAGLGREIDTVVATRGFTISDPTLAAYLIEAAAGRRGVAVPVADKTLAALWKGYVAAGGDPDRAADIRVRLSMVRHASASGRDAQGPMGDLLSAVGRLAPVFQAAQLETICESLRIDSEYKLAKAGPYTVAAEKLADLYASMTDADWTIHRVSGGFLRDITPFGIRPAKQRATASKDGRLAKAVDRIMPILITRLAGGTEVTGSQKLAPLVKQVSDDLDAAIEAVQWPRAVALSALYFRAMPHARTDWDSVYRDDIVALARMLEKARAWEVLHLSLLHLRRANPPQALATSVARFRTMAANNITGLVAVAKNDKTYPLHHAAQLVELGNEVKAWQLTRTRLAMVTDSWSTFEPKYVAWCIDQMRKNAMLKEALELAFTVLLRENDLDPAVAARVLLARGDIYRDKKNFDVARIEYRALNDNPRYRNTPAGTEATYHLVSLLIDTGQYTTALRLIERLVDSVDLPVKAEGYYLMARLAYEQKNYEEASDNIDKVRMCVNDHVEAAFLDGLLKLKLPGGMITPEVEIGTAATRRILIPGEELSLKLQDANLSIAREEKAIPIVVSSTSGKDVERVDLLSLAGRKNLFSGTLRTALGRPTPGNGVLEVSGADRVSYIIAPEFQAKNGIDYPAKFLDIRTLGQLAASAGEILTPAEIEARRVQEGLTVDSPDTREAWKRIAGNMVRPGNEIYVQVFDVDRDVTDGKDTLTVQMTTTNGDIIAAAKLTETSEHSAIFRAAIKTAVPLPKAVASDTFEGKDPSSAINSTRGGQWSSLADGAKGKWLGVDMMSSHEMKTLTATVPDAKGIKSVRLMAMLAGDYREIASFPVTGVQRGLRAETFADAAMTTPASDQTVTSLQAKADKGVAAVRYSGVFVAEAGGKHTFTIKTTGGVSLSVGGKEIIAMKPASGAEATYTGAAEIAIDPAAIASRGETPFVLTYVPAGKADSLSVSWSAGSKSGSLSPMAMFPGGQASRRDEIAVQHAPLADDDEARANAPAVARHFAEAGRKGTAYVATPAYQAPAADWGILQMTGSFYVPAARYMTLKLTGKAFEAPESWARLFVDGKEVLVRARRRGRDKALAQIVPTARVKLTKGVHTLRLAMLGQGSCDATVTYEDDKNQFVPMPAAWFSVDHNPQIAASVSPEGHIGVKGNSLVCELTAPQRLRAVKWVFDDYEGNAVVVSELGVIDASGAVLIPAKADFTSATTNDVLEIAPGDRVSILYVDEKRPEGGSPNRRANLATGYYNGSIEIANEIITDTGGGMETKYYPARRCGLGDALAILVDEADLDVSAKRDTMDVLVQTSSGQRMTLKALEMPSEIQQDAEGKDVEAHHEGKFLALLRLGKEAGKGVLVAKPGDRITVSYMDGENSNPGVAVHRTYELFEGGDPLVEQIDFERYTSQLVRTKVDRSKDRILRTRSEADVPQFTYVRLLRETHAQREGAQVGDPLVTSLRGPLAFSIMYPALAKNTASTIQATVWADSDAKASATAEPKREPRKVTVEMACGARGLDEGVFRGVVRLQVGLPGQNADIQIDEALSILDAGRGTTRTEQAEEDTPVLVVVPGDILHVTYKDPESGKLIVDRIRVLSEGGLEILDDKLQVELDQIRLGEKFHIRVDDADRDITAERDTVTVKIVSKSGDTVEVALGETLGRSGVFTGSIEPKFIGDKVEGKRPTPDKSDDVLSAFFGDEVTFEYVDPAGVNSAQAVTHARRGAIHLGSDARADLFSKQFRDSEMAVKTSFLMAEALFELAKQKRGLNQSDQADAMIARGKTLLEVTIRDYPDTKLKVHARFLLANLAQELGNQAEAIAKYSQVIAMAPQSEQASKSQYKMAQCYEELGKFTQACEEYVKVTYVYPTSPLAPTARVRMGTYYMKRGQEFLKDEAKLPEAMKSLRVAGRIFAQFRLRHPAHALAANSLFLSGQCALEMKDYRSAAETFAQVIEDFPNERKTRAQAMYWRAQCLFNVRDWKGAYQGWTQLIWDYPDTTQAKQARARLLEDKRMLRLGEEDSPVTPE